MTTKRFSITFTHRGLLCRIEPGGDKRNPRFCAYVRVPHDHPWTLTEPSTVAEWLGGESITYRAPASDGDGVWVGFDDVGLGMTGRTRKRLIAFADIAAEQA